MGRFGFSGAALGCALAGSAAAGQPFGMWNGVTRLAVRCAADPAVDKALGGALCGLIADEVTHRSPYLTRVLAPGENAGEARDTAIMQVRIEPDGQAGALRLAFTLRRALVRDDADGARTPPPTALPPGATADMSATRDAIARAVTRALPRTAGREARVRPGPFTRNR